jgi:hypothetical protein
MNINFSISIFALLFIIQNILAQDKKYANDIITKLSSKEFHGRGYVKNGDLKAAMFIADQFQKNGTSSVGKSFLIPFDISINSFPNPVTLELDGKKLEAGRDFMIGSGSPASEGDFKLIHLDTSELKRALNEKKDFSDKIVVISSDNFRKKDTYNLNAAGYIFTSKNLYWRLSDATEIKPYFYFYAIDSLIRNVQKATVEIENEFFTKYKTSNVIAQIKGKKYPDSAFVFTAHYDHLGLIGDVMFPGANDNASGTAMLLDMAKYYGKEENRPDCTIIFMALAAEECGLLGSKYMVANPIFPLSNIKFLFNLDMIGSGSEGIGMYNAKVEPRADKLINAINDEYKLFDDIRSNGARCNSDHCPFAQKSVPSIFIFTRGKEYMHYHTPEDKGPLPLTKWNELFTMLDIFMKRY